MSQLPKIQIRVPGTSANLGPGFDLMGMALKTYNTFSFTFPPIEEFVSELKGGLPPPFAKSEDLVWIAYQRYFKEFLENEKSPTYHCKMDLNLPLKGGLGSSASAIVAGLTLAREVHKRKFPQKLIPQESRFLHFLASFEGHPDNTLPAYLGGLVFTYQMDDVHLKYVKKRFPNSVAVFAFTPEYAISTEESRKNLPTVYKTSDVIFNMSRVGAWMQFLDKRKFSDLRIALEDRIHTPYRLHSDFPLYPLLKKFQEKDIGFCLSGSGPTLLLFAERKKAESVFAYLSEEIKTNLAEQMSYQLKRIQTDWEGTKISFF